MSQDTATFADAHIPGLPNEVLCDIAGYVDDADIANLRLAAKVFHYITADRFATLFFQDRAHELSPTGLQDLVAITEHPVFAPYIRTVIIGHGGKHHSAQDHDKMKLAFQNLKIHGNKISLGLRRVRTLHNFEYRTHRAGVGMDKFLEKMVSAAKQAEMPLEDLIADLQNPLVGESVQGWHQSINPYHQTGFAAFRIKLSPREPSSGPSGHVSFHHSNRRLELSQTSLSMETQMPCFHPYFAQEVHLSDCEVSGSLMSFLIKCPRQVKRLVFQNVHFIAEPGCRMNWTHYFAYILTRSLPLESCEFGKLWNGRDDLWLPGGEKTIKASTKAQVSTVISNLAAGRIDFSLDD